MGELEKWGWNCWNYKSSPTELIRTSHFDLKQNSCLLGDFHLFSSFLLLKYKYVSKRYLLETFVYHEIHLTFLIIFLLGCI